MPSKFHRASTGDTVTVPDVRAPLFRNDPDWEEVLTTSELDRLLEAVDALKGQALDEALEELELSKSGTVAEKRDRLKAAVRTLAQPESTGATVPAGERSEPGNDPDQPIDQKPGTGEEA